MLEREDRKEFMDLMVALFRKIQAGEVRTGYAWKGFPGNPIHKDIVHMNLVDNINHRILLNWL